MAILRCISPFAARHDNAPRVVGLGELVDAGDPIVKGREHLFEPVETFMSRRSTVEEATAAPGSVRTVSTKRTTSKK